MPLSDLLGRRTPATHADGQAADHAGVWIYWRPGCAFCQALRIGLRGGASRARWVNVWKDRDAAAYVRSVNGGNETVPTVVVDGVPHTNPPVRLVRDAVA